MQSSTCSHRRSVAHHPRPLVCTRLDVIVPPNRCTRWLVGCQLAQCDAYIMPDSASIGSQGNSRSIVVLFDRKSDDDIEMIETRNCRILSTVRSHSPYQNTWGQPGTRGDP